MALKFGAQQIVSDEAMEAAFPFVVQELAVSLLNEARPDWDTVVITVERNDMFRKKSGMNRAWAVRLQAQGGTRDCIVRGG